MIENMPPIVNLESEDQRLVFYFTPNTLLNIAASELAFHSWRLEICKILPDEHEGISRYEFSINDILKVSLPESIKILVNYHIKAIKSELRYWFLFHQRRIFDIYRADVFLKCLDCIIRGADGRIIYQKTAEKLLSSDHLNSMEKYRVACMYCFKEHIECLWPSVSSFARCPDDGSIRGDWGCIETDDSSPLQSVNYWNSVQRNENIEGSPLFSLNDMHNLSKLEYFCKNMTQDQLDQLSYYVTKENHQNPNIFFQFYDNIKYLLSKVGITFQSNMLKKCPSTILLTLSEKDNECCRYALQVWHHVKHSISSDTFFDIIKYLWKGSFDEYIWVQDFSYLPVILHEVWISAPHHLRNNFPESQLVHLFTLININSKMRTYGQDFGFVLSILSGIEIQVRRKVWLSHWRKFICLAKLSDLNELMKLCLGNEDDIVQFIKNYMTNCTILKSEFISFIKAGLYQDLVQYLKFFLPDESSVKETQRQILYLLKNEECFFVRGFNFNSSRSRCMKLNEFIESAFPSAFYAQQFKIDFIQKNLNFWTSLLVKGIYLDDIRNLTDCLLSCEQSYLIQVKHNFFQCCQRVLGGLFIRFSQQEWRSFLKWCAPSVEELSKFKKSLPVDDVFTTLLTRVIKGQRFLRQNNYNAFYVDYLQISNPTFSALSNFLLWYFDSEHTVNKFKLTMIENYENVDTIKMVLIEESQIVIMDTLKWFFNHDLERVMKFYHEFKSTNLQKPGEMAVIHLQAELAQFGLVQESREYQIQDFNSE